MARSARRAVDEALVRRGLPPVTVPAVAAADTTPYDTQRMWGWWALGAANLRTARKHALRLVSRQPFEPGNWKLLACVLRDTLRQRR